MPACSVLSRCRSQVGNSSSTFSLSDSGAHLGRPLTSVLLPGILATSSENASLDRRFELLFFLLISRWPRLSTLSFLCGSFSSEVRRRHGVGSLLVVLSSSSSLASPPPVSSWISGRDPLLVVASCNSPEISPQFKFSFIALLCKLSDLFAVF